MATHSRGRTLEELANEAGFKSAESLASAMGVDKSTINRAWKEVRWFDRIAGRTLAGVFSVIPQANESMETLVLALKRQQVTEDLACEGLALNEEGLQEALEDPGIEPQYLYRALSAARFIMTSDIEQAANCLGALWGRPQTRALDLVFSNEPRYPILKDPLKLMEAAEPALQEVVEQMSTTQTRAIAQAHLAHHIGKSGGEVPRAPSASSMGPVAKQRNAFLRRAIAMGSLRSSMGSPDAVGDYATRVTQYGVTRTIELWAFPSWLGDIHSVGEFAIPQDVSLARTAAEVIQEIETYNDSYVFYLCTVFIPLALDELDPHFGQKIPQLVKALEVRAQQTELKELSDAATALIHRLAYVT